MSDLKDRFSDIPGSDTWKQVEWVDKGWSMDKKYHIQTQSGEHYLLRLAPMDAFDSKKEEFEMLKTLDNRTFHHSRPFDFGRCREGVYTLFNWIEGVDLESALPTKSIDEQYVLGVQAGRILRDIHEVTPEKDVMNWEERFNMKLDRKLKIYSECPLKYEHDEAILQYIEASRIYLKDRPNTLHHGDYHVGNMVLCPTGEIGVIDFNRFDYGDPWEEFNRIVWDADVSPAFATGKIDGYFEGEVPLKFFQLLALYITSNTLSSLPWAIPFGEGEIQTMRRQATIVLRDFDDFNTVIPKWYQAELKNDLNKG